MTHLELRLTIGMLLLLTLAACERQSPPPKPIGAATNKHVEDSPTAPSRPDAMIQQMKTPHPWRMRGTRKMS
jgi:hypothetical protein